MLVEIVRRTPPWVFALFAYLVWIGIKRLRPRARDVRAVWITPAIFIVWGLAGLWQHGGPLALTLADWLGGALVGGALGAVPAQRLTADRVRGRVLQRASAAPLLRNVVLFGAHYALNVLSAIHPGQRASLMLWDVAVSGLGAGYFAGWATRFMAAYRSAPQVDLDDSTPAIARANRVAATR